MGFTEPKCYSIYGDPLNGVIALKGNKFYNKEYAKREGIGFSSEFIWEKVGIVVIYSDL